MTPQPNSFVANYNIAFCHQVFYLSMTEIESVVEPDDILDDFKLKSIALARFDWFMPELSPELS
jgi:hypothetical protein